MKIRYYGHIGPTGFGRAAMEMCMALVRQPGVVLEIAPIHATGTTSSKLAESYLPLAGLCKSERDLDPHPDAIIVHTLPWDCVRALGQLRTAATAGTKFVAYTTWEALTTPPELCEALEKYDQVWFPSGVAARALNASNCAIRVVPHCFNEAELEMRARAIGVEGAFQFYYVGAWTVRKNPASVLRAFAHAFSRKDDVELVIQSSGAHPTSLKLAAASTGLPVEELPKLKIRVESISDSAMLDLHRSADCFVTASHGEAWNLPAFDAMLAGRMVIAPAGLGSDEYLAETSAMLYGGGASPAMHDVRLSPDSTGVQIVGVQGLTSRCLWVEPSMPALIASMRTVYTNRYRTMSVHYDPRERFGYDRVGKLAIHNLQEML